MNAEKPDPRPSLEQWRSWWRLNGERELRDLLLVWWDPIGVYGEPAARDEYDGYVLVVGRMLRDGLDAPAIRSYLRGIEENEITLAGDADLAARKVVEWHARVTRRIADRDTGESL